MDKFVDLFNSVKEGYVRVIKGLLKPDGSVRYSILDSNDTPDNMGATVISFDNSNVKN